MLTLPQSRRRNTTTSRSRRPTTPSRTRVMHSATTALLASTVAHIERSGPRAPSRGHQRVPKVAPSPVTSPCCCTATESRTAPGRRCRRLRPRPWCLPSLSTPIASQRTAPLALSTARPAGSSAEWVSFCLTPASTLRVPPQNRRRAKSARRRQPRPKAAAKVTSKDLFALTREAVRGPWPWCLGLAAVRSGLSCLCSCFDDTTCCDTRC